MPSTLKFINFIEGIDESVSAKGMFHQQAVVRFYRHHSEFIAGDVLDDIGFKGMWDREPRLLIEIRATSDSINQNRIGVQEGGRHEEPFEFCVNARRHVLFSESEKVIYQLQGIYDGGFDWVDESEEGLEDFCGLRDFDGRESGVTLNGLRRLGDRECVTEKG